MPAGKCRGAVLNLNLAEACKGRGAVCYFGKIVNSAGNGPYFGKSL